MKSTIGRSVLAAAWLLAGSACTTVYTEDDLAELERRQAEELRSEEMNDEEVGAMGGTAMEQIADEEENLRTKTER